VRLEILERIFPRAAEASCRGGGSDYVKRIPFSNETSTVK
jgi:hypothetical protein